MESSQTKKAGRTRVAGDSFHTSQGKKVRLQVSQFLESYLLSLRGKKVRLQVSQFLGAEFVFVGRHGSGLEDGEFAQVGFREGEQALLLVDELDCVSVFVEATASDDLPVERHSAHRTIGR